MDLKFDHIIYFTEDPNKIKNDYKTKGFHAVDGGTHDVWGTYNTLIHFGLKYIEFLGIKDFEVFQKYNDNNVDYTLMSSIYKENYREGYYDIALRTTEIEAIAEHLKKNDFLVDGPTLFSRTKDDGSVVQWKLLFIKDKEKKAPMPFIIDWGISDKERLENLCETGILGNNGDITQVNIAVEDPLCALHVWQRAFNLEKIDESTLKLRDINIQFDDSITENQVKIQSNNK